MKILAFLLLACQLALPATGPLQAQMIRLQNGNQFFTPLISAYPLPLQKQLLRQTRARGDNAVSLYYGYNRGDNPFNQPYSRLDIRKAGQRGRILAADVFARKLGLRTIGWIFSDQSEQTFSNRRAVIDCVVREIQMGNLFPTIIVFMLEMDEDRTLNISQFHTLGNRLRDGIGDDIPILLHFRDDVWGLGEDSDEIREFWRDADWATGWAVQTGIPLSEYSSLYPRYRDRMRRLGKTVYHAEVDSDDSQQLRDAKATAALKYTLGSFDGRRR